MGKRGGGDLFGGNVLQLSLAWLPFGGVVTGGDNGQESGPSARLRAYSVYTIFCVLVCWCIGVFSVFVRPEAQPLFSFFLYKTVFADSNSEMT